MTLTHAALDEYAREYYLSEEVDDVFIEELHTARGLERIIQMLAGRERVLELGYGTGITTRVLRDNGVNIEVVEGSGLLVDAASAAFPDVLLHHAMFESFDPGPVFDAVLALFVAEHVDDPVELYRTASKWLRPGGRLVVAVPNAGSLHRRLAVTMGLQERLDSFSRRDEMLGHQRVYTLGSLRGDIESAGLRVTDELGWFLKALPNSMMVDYPRELLEGLIEVSTELPPELMANIAVVAER
jgi:SAM-dependent methyltransferase